MLLGAVGDPAYDNHPPTLRPEAGLLALRTALGGFANLRPAVAFEPVLDVSPLKPERVRGADVLVVRELLGGLYYGEPRGREPDGRGAFNTLRYTTGEIERVARVAFEAARTRRRKVTSVDKANVLETSRLWREVVTRVAKDYPDVALSHMYVDSCAMRLATAPTEFDVAAHRQPVRRHPQRRGGGDLRLARPAAVGDARRHAWRSTSRCTARRPTSPARTSPTRSARSAASRCCCATRRGWTREADAVDAATREVLAHGLRPADLARPGDTPVGHDRDRRRGRARGDRRTRAPLGVSRRLRGSVARTLLDKLWDAHVVDTLDGGRDLLYIDLHLIHEVTTPQAFEGLRLAGRQVRRPDLTVATLDHNVSTGPRHLPMADALAEAQMRALRDNCASFGIRLHDLDSPTQGIVHVIGPELGLTQPGMTIVCGDSHTTTHGAFGALAFGIGTSEVEHVLATQCLALTRPKAMRVLARRPAGAGRQRQGPGAGGHRRADLRRRRRPHHRVRRRGRARTCRWKRG